MAVRVVFEGKAFASFPKASTNVALSSWDSSFFDILPLVGRTYSQNDTDFLLRPAMLGCAWFSRFSINFVMIFLKVSGLRVASWVNTLADTYCSKRFVPSAVK